MHDEQKYFLAIDWGKSRVGIAIADDETRLATAYKDVATADFVSVVKKLSQEMAIRTIIFGRIKTETNYRTISQDIEKVAEQLQQLGFAVEFEQEQFSTQQAQKNLAEMYQTGISKNDNAEAARIILQSWLDRQLNH